MCSSSEAAWPSLSFATCAPTRSAASMAPIAYGSADGDGVAESCTGVSSSAGSCGNGLEPPSESPVEPRRTSCVDSCGDAHVLLALVLLRQQLSTDFTELSLCVVSVSGTAEMPSAAVGPSCESGGCMPMALAGGSPLVIRAPRAVPEAPAALLTCTNRNGLLLVGIRCERKIMGTKKRHTRLALVRRAVRPSATGRHACGTAAQLRSGTWKAMEPNREHVGCSLRVRSSYPQALTLVYRH